MTWTLIPVLAIIAACVALRWAVWWMLCVARRLFDSTVLTARKASPPERLRRLRSRLSASFPETVRLVEARLTPTRFTGLPLTLIVVLALYVGGLLGGLVQELLEADELVRLDERVNRALAPLRTDAMVTVFAWVTDLGGSAALIAVVLVTTGLLWAHGHRHLIAPLWLTLVGSQITTYAGKYALARQRPEFVTEVTAVTPSFPSGHATSAMAVYGFIAYLVARDLVSVRQRFEVVYWAAVLVGLIGFSRLLLSLHYASDVAAGFLVGGFWLLVGLAAAEHHRRR